MYYLPISAIFFRHIRLIKNYTNKLMFTFYWPLLDILIWGFLGRWLQVSQNNPNIELLLMLSILLWSVFARVGQDLLTSLFEELWSNNLINIFASPITLGQWIIGALLYMLFLFFILMSFLIGVAYLFYNLSILSLIQNFVIFAPALLLAGISISFLLLSLVIYFGLRVNEIAYAIMWSFMPFCGAFYPIESLPMWAQKVSSFLPMTYVFASFREYVLKQANPIPGIIQSVLLSLIYGSIFLCLFFYMFKKSKDNGLSRLSE